MSDYTPSLDEVRIAYAGGWASESIVGRNAYAEFDRVIALVRAEALREAAEHIGQHGGSDGLVWYSVTGEEPEEDYAETAEYLRMEADRIEKEAGLT